MKFLLFISHNKLNKVLSKLIEFVLVYFYGIKIGKNFFIGSIPKLKIHGLSKNIVFGNNVKILGVIDLRNRENGKIIFKDNVTIDDNCRFVAAINSSIIVDENSYVGCGAIWNAGADIYVGKKCVFAARSGINSNDHGKRIEKQIRDQEYTYAPVYISDDCWIGINVTILKGTTIGKGSVIGAHALVTKDTEEYSISAGIPAKKIKSRN